MESPYRIPARQTRAEIEVVNSRFIATVAPAFSVEEARAFINRIKSEFASATHNVPAFVIGHGASMITHASDDGEPSGTAGKPALSVLAGSGLGDAVVVVTRFFGGTKLGTGGLVRAYGDAVRGVLAVTPRAERVATETVLIAIPYNWVERLRILASQHHGEILDETFSADVTVTARFRSADLPSFQADLVQASNGKMSAEVVESTEVIMPVEDLPSS